MKIAICSDSHDNVPNISKFLFFCNSEEIDTILHCGDWCAPTVMQFFRKNFKGKIYGVYGNVHAEPELITEFAQKHNLTIKQDELEVEFDGIKMILTHWPDNAKKLAQTGKHDIVFYGHNHKPWKEQLNKTYLINPGTLGGLFYRASFATYDTEKKKLNLHILDQIVS